MLWPSSGRGHGVRLRVLGAVLGVAKFPRALLTAKCVAYFGFEQESAERLGVAICGWGRKPVRVEQCLGEPASEDIS